MAIKKLHISTSSLPPVGAEDISIVYGVACLSRNLIKDTMAVIQNTSVGGDLKTYTDLMENGIQIAMNRMEEKAIELGSDGVYGIHLATPHITTGAAEIIV